MFSFAENVYCVEGATGACIYNMSNLKLYRCDKASVELLHRVIKQSGESGTLTTEEANFLNQMLDESLVVENADFFNNGDISNLGRLLEEPKVTFVWIEVTDKCNLKCRHCYAESTPTRNHIMSQEDFKYTIDNLVASKIKKIQLIGGEPLVLGDLLKQMIEYASGKFELLEVYTNGTLLTDGWIDFFKKHNVRVALSLYSYEDKYHDYVTQLKGCHKKTTEAIKKLIDAEIPYRTAAVLMKDVEIGEQKEVQYSIMKKDVVRMSGRGNIKLLDKNLIQKRLITKDTFSNKINASLVYRNLKGHNCFARRVYISYDLIIYPCVMERRVNHGKLHGGNLYECIDTNIQQFGKNQIAECKMCEYRYCCHDCRPDSLEEKAYDKKPWYCTYNPLLGVWDDKTAVINRILQGEKFEKL